MATTATTCYPRCESKGTKQTNFDPFLNRSSVFSRSLYLFRDLERQLNELEFAPDSTPSQTQQ